MILFVSRIALEKIIVTRSFGNKKLSSFFKQKLANKEKTLRERQLSRLFFCYLFNFAAMFIEVIFSCQPSESCFCLE